MKDLDKVAEGLVGGIVEKVTIKNPGAGDDYIKIETDKVKVELMINGLGAEVVDYEEK